MLKRVPVIVCALIFITSSVFAYTISEVNGPDNIGGLDDHLISAWLNKSGDQYQLEAFADYAIDGKIVINQDKDISDMSLWKDEDTSTWQQVTKDDGITWLTGVWAYQFDLGFEPEEFIIKTGAGVYEEENGSYTEVNTLLYKNLENSSFAVIDLSKFYIYDKHDKVYLPIISVDENGAPPKLSHISAQPVPEPSTLLLLGSGLVGLALYGRKRKKA